MKDCIMNRDVLELLNELEELVADFSENGEYDPIGRLRGFIENQRSIYGGAQGECAS